MTEPFNLKVMERERNILNYLFQTKLATFKQLHTNLFKNNTESIVSRRLGRLFRGEFIRKGFTKVQGIEKKVFYLAPGTINLMYPNDVDHLRRYQVQSSSEEHDILLGDVRSRLLKTEPVKKYWTENELQCLKDCSSDLRLIPFIVLRSDAVLEIVSNGERMVTPLELEISRKANNRYIEKFKKYYERTNTICVLYIAGSTIIRNAVMKVERSVLGNNKPKFFYTLLDEILNPDNKVEFTNLDGDRIVL